MRQALEERASLIEARATALLDARFRITSGGRLPSATPERPEFAATVEAERKVIAAYRDR